MSDPSASKLDSGKLDSSKFDSSISADVPLFPTAPHLSLSRAPWDEPGFQRGGFSLPPWAMSDGLLPILPSSRRRDGQGESGESKDPSQGYSVFDSNPPKGDESQWLPVYEKEKQRQWAPQEPNVIEISPRPTDAVKEASDDEPSGVIVRRQRSRDEEDEAPAGEGVGQRGRGRNRYVFPSASKIGKAGVGGADVADVADVEERKIIHRVRKWWIRLQERIRRGLGESLSFLLRPASEEERVFEPARRLGLPLELDEEGREVDGKRRKRITPSNYSAMEIHGYFGLIDDGSCGQGRMLICHVPSWVRGQFLDVQPGDEVHAWHVSGKTGGVLTVLDTGRHRYYSPGARVTTCTICVPEEQWERFRVV